MQHIILHYYEVKFILKCTFNYKLPLAKFTYKTGKISTSENILYHTSNKN